MDGWRVFNRLGFLLLLAVLASCLRDEDVQDREEFSDGPHLEEEEMPKMRRADERIRQEFEMTRVPGTQDVPRQRLLRAKEVAKRSRVLRSGGVPLSWEERGPNNVGGRTRSILIDRNDPTNNTVFAAGVAGGLWRTTNFLSNTPLWTPIDDFFDNIAICAMVQDPLDPDVMYFGTGEGWFNFDAVRGLGIWKSTDGGLTWNQLSSTLSTTFHYVQDLLIDNQGALYASTRTGGVMRSTNGGSSWTSVLSNSAGNASTNRAADLEIGADGSLYATMGIFSTGSVHRSDISFGASQGESNTWTNITPSGNFWRIELATSPSDADRLYIVCQGKSMNGVSAMYRSENGGNSWINLAVPGFCDAGGSSSEFSRGQAWYDLIAAVDPNNPDRWYIGGVDALRSDDKGQNWTQVSGWAQKNFAYCTGLSYVHADHHMIIHLPGQSDQMVWGTDGGLFYTGNATANYPDFTHKNTGYNVTQFYSTAIHPDAGTEYFLGGTQDNGTHRFNTSGMNATHEVTGGDGGFCHIDQENPMIQITSYVYNNYYLSTNGGSSFSSRISNSSGKFINISDYDNQAGKLYAATSSGRFFRWNDPRTGGSDYDIVDADFSGSVTAVFCDPNADNRVWFGTNGPTELVRIDQADGNAFTETVYSVPGSMNGANISSIHLLKDNPDRALVTFSNYGVTSVWIVTNLISGSPVWTNVEGNLPDMPVRWGLIHPDAPDQALLATELGVWSTSLVDGSSTQWVASNNGLANVRVDMLQYRESDGTVVAATHGRGMFTASISTGQAPRTPVVFYQEDFSTPSWTPGGTNGGGSQQWTWDNDPGGIFYNQPDFLALSASNGYYVFNSDFNGQSNHDVTLTSPAIDCRGVDTLILECSNQYAYFSNGTVSSPQLGISTDGVNFTYMPVLQEVIRGSLSESNRIVRLDITPYAANEETVYVQFRWQGYWEYLWRVDDVSLTTFEAADTSCAEDRSVLLEFYEAMDGDNWSASWDTTQCDPCSWYGITCNSEQEITGIDLSNNNLQGALPTSLAEVVTLSTLDLSGNQLEGCFPASYNAFCGQLTNFDFSGNPSLSVPDGDFDLFCEIGTEACNSAIFSACSTAVEILILEDVFISGGTYEAQDSIRVTGMLEPGDSAVLRTGSAIVFKSGFHALPGSDMHAMVTECVAPADPALPPPAQAIIQDDPLLSAPVVSPNPFREKARISFSLPRVTQLQLQLFNAQGMLVSQPFRGQLAQAGKYGLTLEGTNLPPGIYWLVMETEDERKTVKLVKQ